MFSGTEHLAGDWCLVGLKASLIGAFPRTPADPIAVQAALQQSTAYLWLVSSPGTSGIFHYRQGN